MTDITEAVKHKCNHPDCESMDVTECFLPDNQSGNPDEYYCSEHSQEHGYCYGCGSFWGGVESFDFASCLGGIQGLCENCSDALMDEFGDYDDDELDEYYIPDDYY